MGLLGQLNRSLLEELARIAAPLLDWRPEEVAREVERTTELLEKVHGVKVS